ncbi:ceramidase, partial [Baffinella frigidus]
MTVRFEPHGHDLPGFWGDTSSSIDWCERNFVVSFYIAEFFNAFSSLTLCVTGGYIWYQAWRDSLELRFYALGMSVVVVGLGSAAFHGTLQFWGQMWDELPMVWSMLVCFYCHFTIDHPGSWTIALALFAYGGLWAVVHVHGAFTTAFQLHFVLMVLNSFYLLRSATRYYARQAYQRLRLMGLLDMWFVLVAVCFWLCDQFACSHLHNLPGGVPNPQLHAVWHLLTAASSHFGCQFLLVLRQSVKDNAPP